MIPQKKVVLVKSGGKRQGGLEKYTRNLAQGFVDSGCAVTLLTTGTGIHGTLPEEVEIITLGPQRWLSVAHVWEFNRLCQQWLNTHSHDIVFGMDRTTYQTHYRAGNGVHAAYLARRQAGEGFWKSLSLSWNPLHQLLLQYERQAFEHPELRVLFTNSHMVKQEILNHYRVESDRIQVVHNGVQWEEWAEPFSGWKQKRNEHLTIAGLDPDKYQLLFVGHDYRRKGLMSLMRGMQALGRKDIQLSVVGRERDVPRYLGLAQHLGLKDQVFFYGQQTVMLPFYQSADALVIPSLYDPFANVTLEAMAMGLFVVSSKDNGASEILTPESGCCISDVKDPHSVASALRCALERPKSTESAQQIRELAEAYDFSQQLQTLVKTTLQS